MKLALGVASLVAAVVLVLLAGVRAYAAPVVAAGSGADVSLSTLCFPYFDNGDSVTTLQLLNPATATVTYTVSVFAAEGVQASTTPSGSLAATATVQIAADAVPGLAKGAYRAVVESSGPISGVAYLHNTTSNALGAYLGVNCTSNNLVVDAIFAPFYLTATGGITQSVLRLANTDAVTASVSVAFEDAPNTSWTLPYLELPPFGWAEVDSAQVLSQTRPTVNPVALRVTSPSGVHGMLQTVRNDGSALFWEGMVEPSLNLAGATAQPATSLAKSTYLPSLVKGLKVAGATWSSRFFVVNRVKFPVSGSVFFYNQGGEQLRAPALVSLDTFGQFQTFDLGTDAAVISGTASAVAGTNNAVGALSYAVPDVDGLASWGGYGSPQNQGAAQVLLPVIRTPGVTTTVSYQNAGAGSTPVTIQVLAADGSKLKSVVRSDLAPGASGQYDLSQDAGLPAEFAGSVVIQATGTAAQVVAWIDLVATLKQPDLLKEKLYLPALSKLEASE